MARGHIMSNMHQPRPQKLMLQFSGHFFGRVGPGNMSDNIDQIDDFLLNYAISKKKPRKFFILEPAIVTACNFDHASNRKILAVWDGDSPC